MDSKGIGLLTASLLLAGGAGWAAYQYLDGMPNRARAIETVPVVVASKDLTFGTKLDNEHLNLVQFPKDAIPRGTYASVDSVLGQTSKVFLVTGEPILASKLSSVGGGLSVLVRPSMRAISVEVDQVTGVSGFVLPGDRVDVLVTVENAAGSNVAVTKTALQNAEVLAAGVTTDEKGKRHITTQTVTLLVDPTGAEAVALGLAQGQIHLVLRNPVDTEVVKVEAMNTRTVLGMAPEKQVVRQRPVETKRFEPRPGVVPPPPPPAPKPDPSFTVIRGGNISKQQSPTGGTKPNP
jgi:pilus assembly protein CpaB